MQKKERRVATEPYKGVRDFYPEEMAVREHLFETMRDVVEHFGYEEYGASPLEPAELYESKSSEEIVRDQTYTFEDRGGRRVTLRPEMTPSVARLVAARRRELAFPLRWYSIPNVFRYERPQRGRLREHFQLNCDLFGIGALEGDIEVILLAYELMHAFGAHDGQFELRVNNRAVVPETLASFALRHNIPCSDENVRNIIRLMDRKHKLSTPAYAAALREEVGAPLAAALTKHYTPDLVRTLATETPAGRSLFTLLDELERRGVPNIVYDPYLVRGFDYYTGTIFEVFDTSPENRRSLFGGGRYDELLSLFGVDGVPAVGFGMGDVTLYDFLATHHLLPEYASPTDLYLCVTSPDLFSFAAQLAQRLRRRDLTVAVDYTGRKVADQVKIALKKKVQFLTVVGDNEQQTGMYRLKDLFANEEIAVPEQRIADAIFEVLDAHT